METVAVSFLGRPENILEIHGISLVALPSIVQSDFFLTLVHIVGQFDIRPIQDLDVARVIPNHRGSFINTLISG